MEGTPFAYLDHLVTLPVRVGGVEARFVLDTGIGPTVLTERLARAPSAARRTARRSRASGCRGKRSACSSPTRPRSPSGPYVREGHVVGVLDTSAFPEALAAIDGFLSLAFFDETAFTVDYERSVVVVESPESLANRAAAGIAVPVRLERQQPSLVAFLPLAVPGLGPVEVEVDMGSDSLILDAGHASAVGVRLDDPAVRRVEGRDETGNAYVRCFTRLDTTIHVAGEPSLAQDDPDVMFQEIVYDGLVGNAFLSRFTVTYDVPGSRMIFGPRT